MLRGCFNPDSPLTPRSARPSPQGEGGSFDVALAMFHDQGLVATKTLDFTRTVNVTLGLPVPRTSPDHGVAYDIAGKNRADETPMVSALLDAASFVHTSSRRRAPRRR